MSEKDIENKFSYHQTEGAPLKLWDSHRAFDENAMQQLKNTAKLPFIYKHVAGMPDVHWGMGATVGSVIATKDGTGVIFETKEIKLWQQLKTVGKQ